MKFKVPNKCRVAAITYKVVLTPLNDHNLWGQSLHGQRLIKVESETSLEEQRRTFLHEVIHVVNNVFEVGLKESQVERLGNGLDQVIQDLEVDDAAEEGQGQEGRRPEHP